jgi:hypothetical protein
MGRVVEERGLEVVGVYVEDRGILKGRGKESLLRI